MRITFHGAAREVTGLTEPRAAVSWGTAAWCKAWPPTRRATEAPFLSILSKSMR